MSSSRLVLKAPLSGYIRPIEEVPDPVFAQKMVGDGIAIDPTSQVLHSPADGKVIQLHPSKHAVTVQTASGIEILMHIGLDTVMLKGEGFFPLVNEGDKVSLGQPLIDFDADQLALNARSLLTIIVITNSDKVAQFSYSNGHVESETDTVLELQLGEAEGDQSDAGAEQYEQQRSDAIVIPNPQGLHARPSATLANLAKHYQSDVTMEREGNEANAKSVVALMGLNVRFGDTVYLLARGRDADKALSELHQQILDGLGEEVAEMAPAAETAGTIEPEEPPLLQLSSDEADSLVGVSASPGLAIGSVFQLRQPDLSFEENGGGVDKELEVLVNAIEQAKKDLEALQARLKAEGAEDRAGIFAAHSELLEDPDIFHQAKKQVHEQKSAAFAWDRAVRKQMAILKQLDNELLAGRANDLEDVGRRVLGKILGIEVEHVDYPQDCIIIAEDLTPSDTANLDASKVVGFCTTLGGASSHVAIIARAMNLPALAGIQAEALDLPDGQKVILDGASGKLRTSPTDAQIEDVKSAQLKEQQRRDAALAVCHEPANTKDGTHIEVVANIGNLADAEKCVELGGEGVGLLRSEFLYLDRVTEPSEEEQTEIYRDIAKALGKDRPLIIRTLDVGGDKPLPYLPLPPEENPFLGERGIRIGINKPSILRRQVRALIKANELGNIRIMFPMIAAVPEFVVARNVVEEEREKLGAPPIQVGMMIEVPAAAAISAQFAKHADFFSVGTNDLTQYTLAMDRGHPKLAPFVDPLHPGVLKLIQMTVHGANKHDRWVGVCGGVAGDDVAVPLLIGLGVSELSVSVPVLPLVKSRVREMDLKSCRSLAEQALEQPDADAVRNLVLQHFGTQQ